MRRATPLIPLRCAGIVLALFALGGVAHAVTITVNSLADPGTSRCSFTLLIFARHLRLRYVHSKPLELDATLNLRSKSDFIMSPYLKPVLRY